MNRQKTFWNIQEYTGTNKKVQKQAEQTGTDRNRPEQTGTKRNREVQTGIKKKIQEQAQTYMNRKEYTGS